MSSPEQRTARPDSTYSYAVLRVVPSLERGEQLNCAVVLFCRVREFLALRWQLDEPALAVLAPTLDPEPVRRHLGWLEQVAGGQAAAGPIAALSQSERFGWLVAPSSTVVQPGPVHTGLCDDPARILAQLFDRLVRRP